MEYGILKNNTIKNHKTKKTKNLFVFSSCFILELTTALLSIGWSNGGSSPLAIQYSTVSLAEPIERLLPVGIASWVASWSPASFASPFLDP
jgi:hypothetical protein